MTLPLPRIRAVGRLTQARVRGAPGAGRSSVRRQGCADRLAGCRRGHLRQPQHQQRAAARRVRGRDRAAVLLGDLAHDRQAEARARAGRARAPSGRSDRRRGGGPRRRSRARGRGPRARRRRRGPRSSPPGGLHLIALSSRFEIARSTPPLDRPHGSSGRASSSKRDASALRGRARVDRARDQQVEAEQRRRLVLVLGVAREVDQVADQAGQLLQLRDRRRRAAPRRSSSEIRSACVRTSMLVRRLASGVRSSCEASATSWRWASSESSSALEHLVEAAASAASSSLAAGLDPAAEVARRRDLLGRAAQPLDRRDRRARDEEAERRRASAIPPRLTSARITASWLRCRVDLVERPRDLDRLAASRSAPCRRAGARRRSRSRRRTARDRPRRPRARRRRCRARSAARSDG